MKKTIFAMTLFVALATSSFAGGNDANKKLLNDLSVALKSASQVQWKKTDDFSKARFSFNGKTTSAYYNPDDNSLIGFTIHIEQSELPAGTLETVKKKYSDWTITDAIIFIEANGNTNNFIQVKKGKNNLALKVYSNGKVSIFRKMPGE